MIATACALATAAIDPDELLRSLRRVSFRSALTATLATRMVPLLALDAQRIGEAQRRLPGAGRACSPCCERSPSNALDRSLEVAATLEVRGYGAARRPSRRRRPWSRHDTAFAAAAIAIAALLARDPGPVPLLPDDRRVARRHDDRARGGARPRHARAVRAAARNRTMNALELDHVTYRYPGAAAPALRDVTLEIAQGELVVVAGGSASGKSTLLGIASGLDPPLPRRPLRPAARRLRHGSARARTGRALAARSARSSRTPRRR